MEPTCKYLYAYFSISTCNYNALWVVDALIRTVIKPDIDNNDSKYTVNKMNNFIVLSETPNEMGHIKWEKHNKMKYI